jgi:G:T-mismatch repair DNA endonuclease (very short patch repair protein)
LAKSIWEKDKIKNDIIKNLGYNLIIIWESELELLNNEEKIKLLIERISQNDSANC